jgi:hypothetical protein
MIAASSRAEFSLKRLSFFTEPALIIGIVRNARSVERFDQVWEKACRDAIIGVKFLKV